MSLILIPWNDLFAFKSGTIIFNTSLVNHLRRIIPDISLVILKQSRAPLTEILNRKEITYEDKVIIETFFHKFSINTVFLTPDGLRDFLETPEQNLQCYSSDPKVLDVIASLGQRASPLVRLPRYPLLITHVILAIEGVRHALQKNNQVIVWLDVDDTLVVPDDQRCLNWTFNPAVFDLLFQLQSEFSDKFEQIKFKFLTARVPDDQLDATEKAKPYCNTRLIVGQFRDIIQHLGLKISLDSNPIVALGSYDTCPITNVSQRVCLKSKAQYLVEQSPIFPDTTFVLVDDCNDQKYKFEQLVKKGDLNKKRAFFIEAERNWSSHFSTLTCFKPKCSQSSLLANSFLATCGGQTGAQRTRDAQNAHECKFA